MLINAIVKRRSTAAQKLNITSSRSHLIVTLYLYTPSFDSGQFSDDRVSRMVFVDLAGNERVG